MQFDGGQPYSIEVDYYQAAALAMSISLDHAARLERGDHCGKRIGCGRRRSGLCSGEGSDRSDLALPDGRTR